MAKRKAVSPQAARVKQLQQALKREGLDGIIVWTRPNTRYLSGFTGTASLILVLRKGAWFLTDFRYLERAENEIAGFDVRKISKQGAFADVKELVKKAGAETLGFEGGVPYSVHQQMRDKIKIVELKEAEQLVKDLRIRKSPAEVRAMRRASAITDKVFARILAELRPGLTEVEVYWRLRELGAELGSIQEAFPAIVASGPNSSHCHHDPGDRVLRKGDLVIFDMGFKVDGYCSDMTRTVVLGRATAKQKRVYHIVLEAQRRASRAIQAGKICQGIDAVARGYIERQGFGKRFDHGLGHGVGLEVHEAPALARKQLTVLDAGAVVTCEPGIYLPGWGGVRIEDTILVKRGGNESFSKTTKELLEL